MGDSVTGLEMGEIPIWILSFLPAATFTEEVKERWKILFQTCPALGKNIRDPVQGPRIHASFYFNVGRITQLYPPLETRYEVEENY